MGRTMKDTKFGPQVGLPLAPTVATSGKTSLRSPSLPRRGKGRLPSLVAGSTLVVGLFLAPPSKAAAQLCTGDCNQDAAVTVDEVVSLVDLALTGGDVTRCVRGDADHNGAITIDEIIAAVNFALDTGRIPMNVAGTCSVPGDAQQPLKACDNGTTVHLYRCTDDKNCLSDDPEVRGKAREDVLPPSQIESGQFSFAFMTDCAGASAQYIVEAEVSATDRYRDVAPVGANGNRAAGGAAAATSTISPISEAAVRLVAEKGLENFGTTTFGDVLAAVESANPPEIFAGASIGGAADAATATARDDADVQATLLAVLRHDIPISASIDPVGNLDAYKFELRSPTTVILQARRSTGALNPCIEVQIFGTAQPVTDGVACADDTARLNLTLPPGTYAVLLHDRDNSRIGSYDLYYLRLRPEDVDPLPVNEPQSEALGPVGDLDPYTFRLGRTSTVILQATQASGPVAPCIELWHFGSAESTIVSKACDPTSARIDGVQNTGTYFVVVYDQANTDVGSYTLQLFAVPAGTPTPGCVPPPSGLVSWWPAENSSDDIAGRNPAHASGGVTFVPGERGQAFNFDGTGAVTIADSPNLDPPTVTIEGWIRPQFAERPRVACDIDTVFVKGADLTFFSGYGLAIVQDPSCTFAGEAGPLPNGTVSFVVVTTADGYQPVDSSAVVPDDGAYHHVAGTYDGSSIRVYLDGKLQGQKPATGAIVPPSTAAAIGYADAPSRNSVAAIDEVSIYDRALSQAEIQAIVAAGSAGKCTHSTPTFTPSQGPTATRTWTRTSTPSFAPSPTGTTISTPTPTPTVTPTVTAEPTATPTLEMRFAVSAPVSYLNAVLGQDDGARAAASAPASYLDALLGQDDLGHAAASGPVSYLNALPGASVADRFLAPLVVSYENQ
jgi:Concanavalin A-like lectin/glucanases superfamily